MAAAITASMPGKDQAAMVSMHRFSVGFCLTRDRALRRATGAAIVRLAITGNYTFELVGVSNGSMTGTGYRVSGSGYMLMHQKAYSMKGGASPGDGRGDRRSPVTGRSPCSGGSRPIRG